MKRYSIMGRRQVGAQVESEVCQCDSNPEPLATALKNKTVGRARIPMYEHVFVRDNSDVSDHATA